MTASRAGLVVCGDVLVRVDGGGHERAEAVGIAGGRVVTVGSRAAVRGAAAADARVVDAGRAAVIPGIHDFHIHLVGLARTRASVPLDDARDAVEIASRLRERAAGLAADDWLLGRGWREMQLADGVDPLREAVGDLPAFLTSHDGHSAWASPAALRVAGVTGSSADPPGGRIERDTTSEPTGVLRETALDLVAPHAPRLQGPSLRPHLEAVLEELASLGITGATEAGDYTGENGVGADAPLGDSYSTLTDLAEVVDGRLRLTLGIPADALAVARERGHRTGRPLDGRRTMRFGWAKEYADGALGSGTAALFEPATCGDRGTGILRVSSDELDALLGAGRAAGIALAVHAIGDRAAAAVLDAIERAPDRAGPAPDRMEHLQLLRRADRRRLVALGVTASVQPIHAAADRDLVETCWEGRQGDAYAWRSLLAEGARLAAGSDAPVESVNPWLGLFAAVHRRFVEDARGDWRPAEALDALTALAAYTLGPARAIGVPDEGHLRVGAKADLAVLDVTLDELLLADDRLRTVGSSLTVVDGEIVRER